VRHLASFPCEPFFTRVCPTPASVEVAPPPPLGLSRHRHWVNSHSVRAFQSLCEFLFSRGVGPVKVISKDHGYTWILTVGSCRGLVRARERLSHTMLIDVNPALRHTSRMHVLLSIDACISGEGAPHLCHSSRRPRWRGRASDSFAPGLAHPTRNSSHLPHLSMFLLHLPLTCHILTWRPLLSPLPPPSAISPSYAEDVIGGCCFLTTRGARELICFFSGHGLTVEVVIGHLLAYS
jgi:hypothetical protein